MVPFGDMLAEVGEFTALSLLDTPQCALAQVVQRHGEVSGVAGRLSVSQLTLSRRA